MKNKLFGMLIIFVFCFVGTQNVKASVSFCSTGDTFSSASSCSYSNPGGVGSTELNITLYFGKTSSGKYCAEIKNVKLNTWTMDLDNSDSATNRGKVIFDLDKETISKIMETNSCPKLKFVNEYKLTSGKTKKFVASDKDLNGIACKISQFASFGSECWILDGEDYKKIDADDMKQTVEDSQKYRSDDANQQLVDKVKNRADKDETDATNPDRKTDKLNSGNSCSSLLGSGEDSIAPVIKNVFFVTCVIGVILLIFTLSSDFIKAIVSGENDSIASAFKLAKNRIIAVLILLLLPALVSFVVDIINNNVIIITDNEGNKTEVQIGNVSDCDIA